MFKCNIFLYLFSFYTVRSGCYNGSGEDYRDIGHHTDNGYVCIDWSDVPPDVFDVQIYSDAGNTDLGTYFITLFIYFMTWLLKD